MRIGEVAQRSGVSARMLRHYDSLGLVRPSGRTGVGYREYSESDIRRLFEVESLRSLGLSLREVTRALDDPQFAPAGLVADLISRTEQQVAVATELLAKLRHVAAAGPDDWGDVLGTTALLTQLNAPAASARQRAALSVEVATRAPAAPLTHALLREPDLNVAGALSWALTQGDAEQTQRAIDELLAAIDDSDASIRRRAVWAITEFPTDVPAATAGLIGALTSTDADVRTIAALALGLRGEPAAVGELIDLVLRGDRDVAAAEALSIIATDPAMAADIVTRLSAVVDESSDYPLRQRILQALAELPPGDADDILDRLNADPDPRIAATAHYICTQRSNKSAT